MCLIVGLFVVISLGMGAIEVGLLIQPFLNLGLGYYVARQHNCKFRWADALKIIFATGTILIITTMITLASPLVLGLLMGTINALLSVIYIPYRIFQIFPTGGRDKDPSPLEDIKDLINERKRGM